MPPTPYSRPVQCRNRFAALPPARRSRSAQKGRPAQWASALALAVALCGVSGIAGAASVAVQVQDGNGRPLPDTVVYLEQDGGTAGSSAGGKPPAGAEIEQKGLKFLPLVTVIQTGGRITFPNNDKVRHHIYSFSPAHRFDQKLYSGQAATPQVFDKAGTVVLGCNIHDKMIAYVKIVDTPYFGRTDGAGAVRIEVPAGGKYTVKAWHYNTVGGATPEQALLVKAGDAPTTAVFKLPMKPPAPTDAAAQ